MGLVLGPQQTLTYVFKMIGAIYENQGDSHSPKSLGYEVIAQDI